MHLILLTSLGQRGEAAAAREAGLAAYLPKPVRQSQLFGCLTTVMGRDEIREALGVKREATENSPGASPHALPPTPPDISSPHPLITRHSLKEAQTRSRARILLAEDNAINQKIAVRMLEKLGYKTDVVANGLEALAALSHGPYALVLMDCQMPDMDGYAATREIRKREALKEDSEELGVRRKEQKASCLNTSDSSLLTPYRFPIIAMTANAMEGDREKCLEMGMDDYVSKPVKLEELAKVLQRWITEGEERET